MSSRSPIFVLKGSYVPVLLASLVAVFSAIAANAEVLTWNCSFSTRIDNNGTSQEEMFLVFKADTISSRAFMEGNIGIVDVEIFVGDTAFSFTERLQSGAIQTTTITRDGKAVHSRNTVMLGEIVAAQHFGNCVVN